MGYQDVHDDSHDLAGGNRFEVLAQPFHVALREAFSGDY
jgi:hypothetical protein